MSLLEEDRLTQKRYLNNSLVIPFYWFQKNSRYSSEIMNYNLKIFDIIVYYWAISEIVLS